MAVAPKQCGISVALCTCDGARYLDDLLESLESQTFGANELIASDDASLDDTAAKLEAYAGHAACTVKLLRNPQRLGVSGNFNQAIMACGEDCISLCDQDDVWLPGKLAKLAAAMAEHQDAVAVFSDALVVDENLVPLGYTMWQRAGFTSARQGHIYEDRAWHALFKDPIVTGATLMFKRELLPFILPMPENWIHDAWIAQIAVSQGRLVAIDEPLILYRQHGANVIGGQRISISEQFRRAKNLGRLGLVKREIGRYRTLYERLVTFPATSRVKTMMKLTEEKLVHLERRRTLANNRLLRLPGVLGELLNGNYGRFAKDWRNVAADLLMP